ncbi:hypothetical protein V6N11_064877 [Hibiscus sabdariffa]|uniref:Uncharacterized protein n=1 Tax=Hibiscus sabdariffa TaxID=183260 RepID=A0ABR2SI95_9ROSI
MIEGELSPPPFRFFFLSLWVSSVLHVTNLRLWCWLNEGLRGCLDLNHKAVCEGFGDVNNEGGARWGSEGVSGGSARMVMKVEQDEALGGHLGVGN